MKCFTALALGGMLAAIPTLGLAETVVTNATPNGWAFDTRDSNGVVVTTGPNSLTNYVNGPSSPPAGSGSAHLSTPAGGGDGAAELRNGSFSGVPLNSLTALSYWTYSAVNNGQQFPYLGLTISTTGGLVADDILFFEPPYQQPSTGNAGLPDQGPTAMNTWQKWDALHGAWWDNNGNFNPGAGPGGVDSLGAFLALFPDATIVNAGPLGGVRFDVGFASDTDNFSGNVDAFTIGINNANTTFDFEAAAPVPLPSAVSLGYLMLGGMGIVSILRRRPIVKIA